MNYREKIRKAIECPQFGNNGYGEWGALKYYQRVLIKRLLDDIDSADGYILKMQKEKQELIEYLKEKISVLDNISENEKDEDKIYNCLIRRTTFKEILNKIEKR